jgi:hypothetical protein
MLEQQVIKRLQKLSLRLRIIPSKSDAQPALGSDDFRWEENITLRFI